MTDYAGTPKGVSTPDWATLAAQLREAVRLRDFYIAMVRAGTTGAKVGPHIRAYEEAAAKACDNPALLELAEAAERGPVGECIQTTAGQPGLMLTGPFPGIGAKLYALTPEPVKTGESQEDNSCSGPKEPQS